MPWNLLSRSPAPPRRGVMWRLCFYCNENSSVELTYRNTSNSYEWTCPLCEGINVMDETGEIMDYTPEDASASEHDLIVAGSANNGTESPFCRNCQTNHRIVVEALASYLPPEWDSQYKEYEKGLPRYKAELERRYPPYCINCQNAVTSKLSDNNYKARARILGSFLKNKADMGALNSKGRITNSDDFGSTSGGKILRPRWTFQTWLKLFVWTCRGILWGSHMLGFCGLFVINSLYPKLQLRKLALAHVENSQSIGFIFKIVRDAIMQMCIARNRPPDLYLSELGGSLFSLLYRITPFSVLYFFWNYKLLYALLSSMRVTVTGKSDYYRCQCFLFVQLLVGLYILPRMYYWSVSEKAFRLINLFFTTTTTLVLAVSLACLKVRPVEYVELQRQIQHSTDRNNSETTEQGQPLSPHSQLRRNPFSSPPQSISSSQVVPSTAHVVKETMVTDADMMDWKPSFVPEVSMTDAIPAELPDIPKLPLGYSLAPPPNGSNRNAAILKPWIPAVSNTSASSQGKEKYFQHKLASLSHTQYSPTSTINDRSTRDMALAAQRFFPKEEPTGLEDLFDPVLRLSDSVGFTSNSTSSAPLSWSATTTTNDVRVMIRLREWLSASAIVIGLLAVSIYVYQRIMPTAIDRLA
ncbi:Ima1 N-terminal domain-containing protein [Lipomyces chichibuensis]|uniref:Ima1 N-terminal domain-containing protein n=1 Tax=Lipomyces chichibuensis TaxID=1546026 RepID=UPI003343C2CC